MSWRERARYLAPFVVGATVGLLFGVSSAVLCTGCTPQEARSAANVALPLAEKIACAIANAETDDPGVQIACDIAPDLMPAVLVPLKAHRMAMHGPSSDAGGPNLKGTLPCR